MKSFIIYGSPFKLSKAHKKVTGNQQPDYFVRVDTVSGDLTEAFNKARPFVKESVLNTIPVPIDFEEAFLASVKKGA
jgi:hypothetical protein